MRANRILKRGRTQIRESNQDSGMDITNGKSKKKKILWKKYLGSNKDANSYNEYKRQTEIVKTIVKEAKAKARENFRNKTKKKDTTGNAKLLYRTEKGLRKEKGNRLNNITDNEGKIPKKEKDIRQR